MAQIHTNPPTGEQKERLDLHKKISSMECKVKDARHHAEEWEKVALDIGKERIELMKTIGKLKNRLLYERIIGCLLLSISLALALHQ